MPQEQGECKSARFLDSETRKKVYLLFYGISTAESGLSRSTGRLLDGIKTPLP